MATYTFPANAALEIVQRDLLPRITADRPIFDILPIKNSDNHLLIWTQMDNIIGVQQARGMDGQPPRVKKTGAKQYIFNPGIYGEFLDIDEQELTAKGSYAVPGAVYDLTEEVSERQLQLKQREMDRIEQLGWRTHLLHSAVAHDHHPVGQRERLFLVVGDVDRGGSKLGMDAADFLAHFQAQLGVEVRQRLVHQHQ